MAEIKSAVELAMERTKGLRLSQKEMEKMKEEEIQAKAQGLVNRYLEADFHLREAEKELAKSDPSQRQVLENLFVQHLSAALNLDRDNDLILKGLETFRPEKGKILKRIRERVQSYQEKKKEEYRNTEMDLRAKLERMGISGSAVQAKAEGTAEWEEALAKFKPPFEEELSRLKKDL